MAHVPTLGVQQQNHSWWLSFNPIWKNMKVKMRVIFPIKIGVKIPQKKWKPPPRNPLESLEFNVDPLELIVSLPQAFFIPPFSAHQRIGICNTCILEQMLGWAILMGFHGQKPVFWGGGWNIWNPRLSWRVWNLPPGKKLPMNITPTWMSRS